MYNEVALLIAKSTVHCILPQFHEFVHSPAPPTARSTASELPPEQHPWVGRIDHGTPHDQFDDNYTVQGPKQSRTPCN